MERVQQVYKVVLLDETYLLSTEEFRQFKKERREIAGYGEPIFYPVPTYEAKGMDKLKRLIELKEAHQRMDLNEDDYIGIAQVIDEAIRGETLTFGAKPCPFCGHEKPKLMFREVDFSGKYDEYGDKKNIAKYVFYVKCNKCHSRSKPIKSDYVIGGNPWSDISKYSTWAGIAMQEWNRRAE